MTDKEGMVVLRMETEDGDEGGGQRRQGQKQRPIEFGTQGDTNEVKDGADGWRGQGQRRMRWDLGAWGGTDEVRPSGTVAVADRV
ncbi:hypothetical protein GUJ93_ZPchr0008g11799 [Zizania palustris]|uniref:Uncharacterized protein n=1 Tax=Zizania palustris TaxID=103762 RepID=A0A8J5RHT7_ZIZPA|nr:hypothetical protein GUJ93_ZPchr0008g11799 [Zizania palustris]